MTKKKKSKEVEAEGSPNTKPCPECGILNPGNATQCEVCESGFNGDEIENIHFDLVILYSL